MTWTIQLRRDTAANWTTQNPVLASGELGIETDTSKGKLGNGVTTWNSLPYWQPYGTDVEPVTLLLQAATPLAGFALQNATPTIISWTAPNDGVNHRVLLISNQQVTSALTGGQVTATVTTPDGNTSSPQVYAANNAGGFHSPNATMFNLKPGTTFSLQQATAMTAGASAVFAEIWAI